MTLIALDSAELQAELVDAFVGAEITEPLRADTADQLRQILATRDLDLIVMNSVLAGVYAAPMITEIRRGTLGTHPFPIVLVLVADPDPASLRQVSNCGPDDVITEPCSAQTLLDSINVFLAGHRRPLVVNDGYAGPERRVQNRP